MPDPTVSDAAAVRDDNSASDGVTGLQRSLTLPLLTLYGLGTIIGAGVYVLIGEVAGLAGIYAPFAFLLAATVAGFTAFSYAELTARYPRSAAEAVYLQSAFGQRWLSGLAGWAVVAVGLVSSATLVNGFVGYIGLFVALPDSVIMIALVGGLAAVAGWGIREAAWFAAIVTVIEVAGLLLVVALSGDALATLPERWPQLLPPPSAEVWSGISLGAFLAFYAFIGFEDMANVAEEVKQPQRTLPLGIILALLIATLLYVLIAVVAVSAMPVEQLAASETPLVSLVSDRPRAASLLGVIGLIAVINGALIQLIMASRMIYGMAQTGAAPVWFAKVQRRTHTPLRATVLIALLVLGFALWLPLLTLAKLTSLITLLIFIAMNAALWQLKRREPQPPGVKTYPLWVPVVGLLLILALLVAQFGSAF